MYQLKLKHHFDSSHKLDLNYESPCQRMHGHRWEVEVVITCDELINDMIIDFKELKSIINHLDHQCLNDLVDFNPTAENIAKYLKDMIQKAVKQKDFKVEVTIWESPEASITYI